MYPYILCNCGCSLGHLYDAFKAMKAARYQAAYEALGADIDPVFIPLCESLQVNMGEELDQLGLTLECCRIRMFTQVEMKTMRA